LKAKALPIKKWYLLDIGQTCTIYVLSHHPKTGLEAAKVNGFDVFDVAATT